MDAKHDLKNRYMHIDFDGQSAIESANACGQRSGFHSPAVDRSGIRTLPCNRTCKKW